jgi:hypothetical protein
MKLLRQLFGLNFPDPAVDQIWRSRNSGGRIRVARVQVSDHGDLHIDVCRQYGADSWTPPDHYASGLAQWRRRLRDEARSLVPPLDVPNPRQMPPRPMPPAPPPITVGFVRRNGALPILVDHDWTSIIGVVDVLQGGLDLRFFHGKGPTEKSLLEIFGNAGIRVERMEEIDGVRRVLNARILEWSMPKEASDA